MTSSEVAQPQALQDFLAGLLKDPFNKFCIDCKKNKTTHALIWLGTFVCGQCAQNHLAYLANGQQSQVYCKEVHKEQWDDYQLRSVQFGANKAFFNVLKEYDLLDADFAVKYKHAAVNWHKKRLRAQMAGEEFTKRPPAVDNAERG